MIKRLIIELQKEVHAKFKTACAKKDDTMKKVISKAIEKYIKESK